MQDDLDEGIRRERAVEKEPGGFGVSERAEYRVMYTSFADDADVHAMSPTAFKLLFMLKLSLPVAGIGVVYPSKLCDQVGVDRPTLEAAFAELEAPKPGRDRGWILRDRNIVWTVNALQFESGLTPANGNHVKYVRKLVANVDARSSVVAEFKKHYHQWFQELAKPIRKGSSTHSKGKGKPSPSDADPSTTATATASTTTNTKSGDLGKERDDPPPAAAAPLFDASDLPGDIVAFGARFYGRATSERRRDVLEQLLALANGDTVDYRGAAIRAGSADRLIAACRAIHRVHDTDKAIAVLLAKLGDTTDLTAADVARDRDERLADERSTAGDIALAERWLSHYPDAAAAIEQQLDAQGFGADGIWAVGRAMARRGLVLAAWRSEEPAHA